MYHLRPVVVAESLADLRGAQPFDQPQVACAVLRQAAGDLLAAAGVDPDRLPALEVTLDANNTCRQQALSAAGERARRPIVGDHAAVAHRLGQHPALAALE